MTDFQWRWTLLRVQLLPQSIDHIRSIQVAGFWVLIILIKNRYYVLFWKMRWVGSWIDGIASWIRRNCLLFYFVFSFFSNFFFSLYCLSSYTFTFTTPTYIMFRWLDRLEKNIKFNTYYSFRHTHIIRYYVGRYCIYGYLPSI